MGPELMHLVDQEINISVAVLLWTLLRLGSCWPFCLLAQFKQQRCPCVLSKYFPCDRQSAALNWKTIQSK